MIVVKKLGRRCRMTREKKKGKQMVNVRNQLFKPQNKLFPDSDRTRNLSEYLVSTFQIHLFCLTEALLDPSLHIIPTTSTNIQSQSRNQSVTQQQHRLLSMCRGKGVSLIYET